MENEKITTEEQERIINNRKSFLMYFDRLERRIGILSDEQLGKYLKYICRLEKGEETDIKTKIKEDENLESMTKFCLMEDYRPIEVNRGKYIKKCANNKGSANARWESERIEEIERFTDEILAEGKFFLHNNEMKEIIHYYFAKHKEHTGHELKRDKENLRNAMREIEKDIEDENSIIYSPAQDPDCVDTYKQMIDNYFEDENLKCDYSLNHFTAENIRKYRYLNIIQG